MSEMVKLHIGCGWRNFGEEWVHIDRGDYSHLDYRDVLNLEFNDNTADVIYASHVLGYFNRDEVNLVLKEWRRVLKPEKGILRIAVPDFEVISHLYSHKQYSLDKFTGPMYGQMKMGPDTIYHKTVYDFNSLRDVLIGVGFKTVARYNWRNTDHSEFDDHSQAYLPHMDKVNGVLISLNVEACK